MTERMACGNVAIMGVPSRLSLGLRAGLKKIAPFTGMDSCGIVGLICQQEIELIEVFKSTSSMDIDHLAMFIDFEFEKTTP
jgi:hypothetical protein